jgi:hypothetical protein
VTAFDEGRQIAIAAPINSALDAIAANSTA